MTISGLDSSPSPSPTGLASSSPSTRWRFRKIRKIGSERKDPTALKLELCMSQRL